MIAGGPWSEAGPSPDFGMTDLEEALRGPEGEQVRQAAIARIDGSIRRIEDHLDLGVDPREIDAINRLLRSLSVARKIVLSAHKRIG